MRLRALIAGIVIGSQLAIPAQFLPGRSGSFRASTSAFTYTSVVFDGSADYNVRGADLTGNADGQLGVLSLWIKMGSGTSPTTEYRIATSTSGHWIVRRSTSGKFDLTGTDSGGTIILRLLSTANITNVANWYHIIASWDMSTAGRRKVFVDGADVTDALTFTTGTTIDYTVANHWIGSSTAGAVLFDGLLCEYFVGYPTNYFDLTTAGNLQKFRTSGGKPENLGANGSTPLGVQPIIYLHNPATGSPNWTNNVGSGGNFGQLGALGDGGADIP